MNIQAKRKREVSPELRPVAERIRTIRKAHGLSQEKFAEMMGVGRSAVVDWEGQITPIDARNLMKMCKLFNCDADYILGRITQRTHDIQYISEKTGLSSHAVEELIDWKDSDTCCRNWANDLSRIIESDGFYDMMNRISAYLGLNRLEKKALDKNAPDLASSVIDQEMSELWNINRYFVNIIESLGMNERIQQ